MADEERTGEASSPKRVKTECPEEECSPFEGVMTIAPDSCATISLKTQSDTGFRVITANVFSATSDCPEIESRDLSSSYPEDDPSPKFHLCFLCKLSFAQGSLIIDHASRTHAISCSEHEQTFYSHPGASVAIQPHASSGAILVGLEKIREVALESLKLATQHLLENNDENSNQEDAGEEILPSEDGSSMMTSPNMSHLSANHARNSSKTLKCPKCNWHYKYQQTLEAHMKEKHSESLSNCEYCVNNDTHPKLARGETYSCGYKPFKCEVCNYSTTTKGNLSIHMQSDKHLNNVQDLKRSAALPDGVTSSTAGLPVSTNASAMSSGSIFDSPTKAFPAMMTGDMGSLLALHQSHDAAAMAASTQADLIQSLLLHRMLEAPAASQADASQAQMLELRPPGSCDSGRGLFTCTLCNKFASDDLQMVQSHALRDRTSLISQEFSSVSNNTFKCLLCNYSTSLKANFTLHSQTEKHKQKVQVFNHLKEGSDNLESILGVVHQVSPIQIMCNACEFPAKSIGQLSAHLTTDVHLYNVKLYEFFNSMASTSEATFRCKICDSGRMSRKEIVSHVQGVPHASKVQSKQDASTESWRDMFEVLECGKQEKVASGGSDSYGEAFNCPLCSKPSRSRELLRDHIVKEHSVSSECIDNLMSAVKPIMTVKPVARVKSELPFEQPQSPAGPIEKYRCHRCSSEFLNTNELFGHVQSCMKYACSAPECCQALPSHSELSTHKSSDHSEQDSNLCCWEPKCGQNFLSEENLISHFFEAHLLPETTCSRCLATFISISPFSSHVLSASCDDNSRMTLDDFRDRLMDSEPIAKQYSASSQRSHKCEQCSVGFLTSEGLQRHNNRTHPSSRTPSKTEKPYRCDVCDVAYGSESTLLIHVGSLLHRDMMNKKMKAGNLARNEDGTKAEPDNRSPLDMAGMTSEMKSFQESVSGQQQLQQLQLLQSMDVQTQMNLLHQQQQFLIQQQKLISSIMPFYASPSQGSALAGSQQETLNAQHALLNASVADMIKSTSSAQNFGVSAESASSAKVVYVCKLCGDQSVEQASFCNHLKDVHAISSTDAKTLDSYCVTAVDPASLQSSQQNSGSQQNEDEDDDNMFYNNEDSAQSENDESPSDNENNEATAESLMLQQAALYNQMMLQNPAALAAMSGMIPGMGLTPQMLASPFMTMPNATALMEQSQSSKQPRTKISDEQLAILKQNFDISNSPSDEQYLAISVQTGLPMKVIKHWFRNTLFKERQKDKDSPYNFSNPPSSTVASQAANTPGASLQQAFLSSMQNFMPNGSSVGFDASKMAAFGQLQGQQAAAFMHQHAQQHNSSKRATRTRFTDHQIKALQDFFDQNPYPRDDDLETLSKNLNLSPRVVVVWFQNQRQKARRSLEIGPGEPLPERRDTLQTAQPPMQANSEVKVKKENLPLNNDATKLVQEVVSMLAVANNDPQPPTEPAMTTARIEPQPAPNSFDAVATQPRHFETAVSSSESQKNSVQVTVKEEATAESNDEFYYTCNFCTSVICSEEEYDAHQRKHLDEALNMSATNTSTDASLLAMQRMRDKYSQSSQPEQQQPNGQQAQSQEGDYFRRMRTTISPDQLEVLYEKYGENSNPSRSEMEAISAAVGLSRRVVQVWYQNTRARQRRGQCRVIGNQVFHCKCPYCDMICKSKSHLTQHLQREHIERGKLTSKSYGSLTPNVTVNAPPPPPPNVTMGAKGPTTPVMQSNQAAMAAAAAVSHKLAHKQSAAPIMSTNQLMAAVANQNNEATDGDDEDDGSVDVSFYSDASNGDEGNTRSPDGKSQQGCISLHTALNSCMPNGGGGSLFNLNHSPPSGDERKRHRTNLSMLQIKTLKSIFAEYKTPTMTECETIGSELNLSKRVVQVWFQNARSKEKKIQLRNYPDGCMPAADSTQTASEGCTFCGVKYSSEFAIRDHLFTRAHVNRVKQSMALYVTDEADLFDHQQQQQQSFSSRLQQLDHKGSFDFFSPGKDGAAAAFQAAVHAIASQPVSLAEHASAAAAATHLNNNPVSTGAAGGAAGGPNMLPMDLSTKSS